MTALTLRELTKTFPGAGVPAVKSVSVEVPSGELTTLLGPSGCGKTTLLRLITGFIKPESGQILLDDTDITPLPPHQRDIGMVYQDYALWPHMTVAANVAFGLEMRGVRPADRREQIHDALEMVSLSEYANRYPTQLSGGQQQRVALARALVIRPRLLLMDEPLSSLDANLRTQLRYQIRELQQQLSVTTVFVTHDQEEALAVSDRVILMEAGSVVQQGSGESLYRGPNSRFAMTFMGETNVFEGVVESLEDDRLVLRSGVGDVGARGRGGRLGVGQPVVFGMRPEDLAIARESNGSGTLAGRVRTVTFLGPWIRYEVECGSELVVIRRASSEGIRPEAGEAVFVDVPSWAVYVVTEEDEVADT